LDVRQGHDPCAADGTTLGPRDYVIGLKIDRIRVVKVAFGRSKERAATILEADTTSHFTDFGEPIE
jgi:hypothetical protein